MGWNDWTLGRSAINLGDYDADKSEPKDHENLSYGDGRVEFQKNPFVDVARDNVYSFWSIGKDKDANGDGIADFDDHRLGKPLVKSGAGDLALNGQNNYGGSAVVNGGELQLGTSNVVTATDVGGKVLREILRRPPSGANVYFDQSNSERKDQHFRPNASGRPRRRPSVRNPNPTRNGVQLAIS